MKYNYWTASHYIGVNQLSRNCGIATVAQGMATFSSDKKPLGELLKDIKTSAILLPDFQRGWEWDEDRIKGLLASVSLSYPIGAVMMLEGGNPDKMMKCRPIEGVVINNTSSPEQIILDGQ